MSFSIDQFVGDALTARRESDSAVAVRELLERTVQDHTALEAAVGAPSALASFTTWHNSDELTVLHVVWPPGVDLFPHDHMMWAAIGLYGGREDNRLYRRHPDSHLEPRAEKTLWRGDTVSLGADTVHAVANPSREWTAAIHVYGGDYFRDGRTMWPDATDAPVAFDAERLVGVLEDAARVARIDREDSES